MLNIIWVSFFVLGFIAALVQSAYLGASGIWSNIVGDIFSYSHLFAARLG